MQRRILLWVSCLLVTGLATGSIHAQPDNLLLNGDMSETPRPAEGVRGVPPGWTFLPLGGNPNSDRHTWPPHARSTPFAWRIFGQGGNWVAAGYQTVEVQPGSRYQLTAHGFLWTCNDTATSCIVEGVRSSNIESGAQLRIGLDPQGGNNPQAESIIWSPWAAPFDAYEALGLQAEARTGQMTAFLQADAGAAMAFNEAYWDDISLVQISQGSALAATTPATLDTPTASLPPTNPAPLIGAPGASSPVPVPSATATEDALPPDASASLSATPPQRAPTEDVEVAAATLALPMLCFRPRQKPSRQKIGAVCAFFF
ncbi:MAG: hypothetical protein HC915_03565 [Anaerolineae bacterium]|nr:hypothetical protein [Anaerolineae bacterium]